MGAYITIINDSPAPWLCKVKTEVPELSWQGISPAVLHSVTAAFAITPELTTTQTNGLIFGVNGVPESLMGGGELVATGVTTNGGSGLTRIGSAIAGGVVKALQDNNYVLIMPGNRNKFTRLPPKANQQVDCKRVSTAGIHVSMTTLWMNNIATGKENSTLDYSISVWLSKKEPKIEVIDAHSDPAPKKRELEQTE